MYVCARAPSPGRRMIWERKLYRARFLLRSIGTRRYNVYSISDRMTDDTRGKMNSIVPKELTISTLQSKKRLRRRRARHETSLIFLSRHKSLNFGRDSRHVIPYTAYRKTERRRNVYGWVKKILRNRAAHTRGFIRRIAEGIYDRLRVLSAINVNS